MALFDERRKELMARVLPAMGRFLGARERSQGEVVDYLKRKQLCFAEDYDQVLELLADQGWLDDRRFTRNRISHRLHDGYGPYYIRQDLAKFRVPREIVEEVFAEFDAAQVGEAARLALQKKERQALAKDDPRAALVRALQYRGFGGSCIRDALRNWQARRQDGDPEPEGETGSFRGRGRAAGQHDQR